VRSAFDKVISATGLALVAVLLVAGGLLTWAHSFVGDQVHNQLTMQGITMPEGDALTGLPKTDAKALEQYAGSPMDTGPEAKAFANHYILAHMNEASKGQTYEQVSGQFVGLSAAAQAAPAGQALGQLRQTLFMGDTLRGLLLYGYAFATMGTIAGIAAIVSFVGAAVLLLLAGLGLWHSRRAEQSSDLPVPGHKVPLPA
jgi:hypothetical protein